ncbi:MAG: HDOD domain-containing protein [Deltaproteobacteria bacterium]|nr:HDOD domain-containing protein [Deltaproteobacteria bacterium]
MLEVLSSTRTREREWILIKLMEIDDLPTLPSVFLNIIKLMRDPNTSMVEIARAIEADPALSMKILRLINSSFYGLAKTVKSVQQAIVMLGANTIKNIVISASIIKALETKEQTSSFNREALWQHSIGCGLIAHHLGNRIEFGHTEEKFVAGILHDVGKIILDIYFHSELRTVIRQVQQKNMPFYKAEREILGIDHGEIGAYVAETWLLPDVLVEVIAKHHDYNDDHEYADLIALIQFSDMLVRKYQVGSGGNALVPELDPLVWQRLNLDEDSLAGMEEELKIEASKVLGPIVEMRK